MLQPLLRAIIGAVVDHIHLYRPAPGPPQRALDAPTDVAHMVAGNDGDAEVHAVRFVYQGSDVCRGRDGGPHILPFLPRGLRPQARTVSGVLDEISGLRHLAAKGVGLPIFRQHNFDLFVKTPRQPGARWG